MHNIERVIIEKIGVVSNQFKTINVICVVNICASVHFQASKDCHVCA